LQRGVLGFAHEHAVHGRRAEHRRLRGRRGVRSEAEQRRAEARLELCDGCDVRVQRGRRARKQDQRRRESFPIERRDEVCDAAPFRRQVDKTDVGADLPQQRRDDRQGVGRLRRAQDFLALLAAPLSRERDAVDEGWVHEQRLAADHECTIVNGIARRLGRSAVATAGSGASSTLQQRRQTGNRPLSSSRLRICT
jgi:hypothetical protein